MREGRLRQCGLIQGSHITTAHNGPHQWSGLGVYTVKTKVEPSLNFSPETASFCCSRVTRIGFFQYNLVHPVPGGR